MSPVLHLLLLVLSLACLALSAWAAPQPEPMWKRLVSLGLTFLVASMISW